MGLTYPGFERAGSSVVFWYSAGYYRGFFQTVCANSCFSFSSRIQRIILTRKTMKAACQHSVPLAQGQTPAYNMRGHAIYAARDVVQNSVYIIFKR